MTAKAHANRATCGQRDGTAIRALLEEALTAARAQGDVIYCNGTGHGVGGHGGRTLSAAGMAVRR